MSNNKQICFFQTKINGTSILFQIVGFSPVNSWGEIYAEVNQEKYRFVGYHRNKVLACAICETQRLLTNIVNKNNS